jgi:hypothetical protein
VRLEHRFDFALDLLGLAVKILRPFPGDAVELELGILQGDVRIEPEPQVAR